MLHKNKSTIALSLFFLLYTSNSFTVLIEVNKLCINHNNTPQEIYLLGEIHENKPEDDLKQLKTLHKKLSETDEKTHILVEQPLKIDHQNFNKKVTQDISNNLKNNPLDLVTIEDAEIRTLSSAASTILLSDPKTLTKDITYNNGQKFHILTFNHVIESFNQLKKKFTTIKSQKDNKIALIFEKKLLEAQISFDELIKCIKSYQIDVNESLFSIAKYLSKEKKEILRTYIRISFKHFFDLHLFNRMLILQHIPKLIVIAGLAHTNFIRQKLINHLNAKIIKFIVTTDERYFTQPVDLNLVSFTKEPSFFTKSYNKIVALLTTLKNWK